MPGFGKRVLVWLVERTVEAALFAILLFAFSGTDPASKWPGVGGNLVWYGWFTFIAMGYTGYGITTWVVAIWGIASSRTRLIINVSLFVVLFLFWMIVLDWIKAIPLVVIGAGFVAFANYVGNLLLKAISGKAQAPA